MESVLANPKFLGGAILLWSFVAWGGRIGLLNVGDDWSDLVRIVGSLVVGILTAMALFFERFGPWRRPLLYAFAIWTLVIWTRSMIVNWSQSGTLPFKLVHTLLALGFGLLVWWCLTFARGHLVTSPDQTHSEQKG